MSYETSRVDYFLSRVGGELVLNHEPKYVQQSTSRILVIGGGVTGLTTAWALLDAGYKVTVISDRWAPATPRITSQIAGALWEWPPAVCGRHTDTISLTKSKKWCMTAYHAFSELSKTESSVRMRMANFFFHKKIEDVPNELLKMREIADSGVQLFHRDPELIVRHAVNQNAGVVDSYAHLAPVIDTDAYMVWLKSLVVRKGGRLVTTRICGDLLESEDQLLREHQAVAIVNATGLEANELAGDNTLFPLRGALIRVINDGTRFPKVTDALCVTHDDTRGEDDIVFIVPRNDDILILGGLAQLGEWELNLTLDSPEIRGMRERCNNFVPGLENAEYDSDVPLVQGLRPFRKHNVRVELEPRARKRAAGGLSRIVHTYGHGGAGFSLSFGCAGDVLGLIEQLQKDAWLMKRGVQGLRVQAAL